MIEIVRSYGPRKPTNLSVARRGAPELELYPQCSDCSICGSYVDLDHAARIFVVPRETAASHNLKEKAVQKSSAQRQEF